MRILEVCVDNYESAIIAAKSGADRLELCQDLSVGGLTPTAGFISTIKDVVSVPVFVLIRPRPGNFQYDSYEIRQMLKDIKISKDMGADGLVIGALKGKNEVDMSVCQLLLSESKGLPVTFHRAFDLVEDKIQALEDVIQLGFQRILTSGGFDSAEDGIDKLQKLISQAGDRIIIMPGGNVNAKNLSSILRSTNAQEFHSSGRVTDPDSPTKKSNVCSEDAIKCMREILGSPTLFPTLGITTG